MDSESEFGKIDVHDEDQFVPLLDTDSHTLVTVRGVKGGLILTEVHKFAGAPCCLFH